MKSPSFVFIGGSCTAIRDFEAESVGDVNLSTHKRKEDQQSARLAFFRPVALTVEAELTLHLLKVTTLSATTAPAKSPYSRVCFKTNDWPTFTHITIF